MDANKIIEAIEAVVRMTSLELQRDSDRDCTDVTVDHFFWIRCSMAPHCCVVGVEKPLAARLAIGMYDVPRNTLNEEEILDALKELTNIIAGRLQSVFYPNTEIGLPKLVEYEDLMSFSCQQFTASELVRLDQMSLFVGVK
jgi:hypothetical protein